MESSLISELKQAKEELESMIVRLNRLDAFNNEFMEELKNMNLSNDQKEKLEKMIMG